MATVVRATMSEWHQVEIKRTVDIDLNMIEELYCGHKTTEECQVIFSQLLAGDLAVEELEEDVDDFPWEDNPGVEDWWTMRKGGFDISYSQDAVDPNNDKT